MTAKRQMMELITRDKWKVKMFVWDTHTKKKKKMGGGKLLFRRLILISALRIDSKSISLPFTSVYCYWCFIWFGSHFQSFRRRIYSRDTTGPFDRWLTAEVASFFCFLAEMSACVVLLLPPRCHVHSFPTPSPPLHPSLMLAFRETETKTKLFLNLPPFFRE